MEGPGAYLVDATAGALLVTLAEDIVLLGVVAHIQLCLLCAHVKYTCTQIEVVYGGQM